MTTIQATKWKADADGFAAIITDSGLRIELGAKSNKLAQEAKETILQAVNEREALLAVVENQERAIKLAIVNLNLARRVDAPNGFNGYVTNAINGLEAAVRKEGAAK